MRNRLLAAALLCLVSVPAFAQAPVYTNADLGKPRAKQPRQISDAEYRSLVANQFVYVPNRPRRYYGPTVAIAQYTLPWTATSMPQPSWLAEPFYMSTYVGRGFQGYGGGGRSSWSRGPSRHEAVMLPPAREKARPTPR